MSLSLAPDFVAPKQPYFSWSNLPEEQSRYGNALYFSLGDMSRSASELGHALALFSFSDVQRQKSLDKATSQEEMIAHLSSNEVWLDWQAMAVRVGGLSLRNWGQALGAVQSLIGKVPQWVDEIDRKEVKSVRVEFDKKYPTIDKLRHAIAHPELYSNVDKDMSAKGPFSVPGITAGNSQITISNSICHNNYAATFDGVVVQYCLDDIAVLDIIAWSKRVFNAFSSLQI